MERKYNKQLWLENVLKKLYEKVDSLEATEKPRNHEKRKQNVPFVKMGDRKRKEEKEDEKEDINPETITPNKKLKQQTEYNDEKFWNFVDKFIQSKPFHASSKNGFFNSVKVPSTVNCTHWKSDELKTEIEEEITLEERISLKIQRIRMKKATDAISKEVLKGGVLKKAKKC